MSQEPIRITVTAILADLANGYTRTVSDKQYSGEGKSIEEKYSLSKTQVASLFQHEKLRGRKTKIQEAPAFILIDDEDGEISLETTSTKKSTKVTKVIEEPVAEAKTTDPEPVAATDVPDWL